VRARIIPPRATAAAIRAPVAACTDSCPSLVHHTQTASHSSLLERMQLQIASAALKFCIVVGLWSIYVADWQLALANIAAVAIGYRWLRQIRTKHGRTAAGDRNSRSVDKRARSPLSELQRRPSIEHVEDVQRAYPQSVAAHAVEDERRDGDRHDPNGNTLSGSTVAVAAAFLTAFADSRESKADAKTKPVVNAEGLNRPSKQSSCHDAVSISSSQHQTRRAVEVSQQPKSRKSMLVRHTTADVSNEMVDPEAERAARRAEMELLELLDAEANAQQSRKKTAPTAGTAMTPSGTRGATDSFNAGANGSEDPADPGRGTTAGSDSQAMNGGAAARKGQKPAQRPAEVKTEKRGPNKKQPQRPADTKADNRLQGKASDTSAELIASEGAAAVAAVTPRRPSEKNAPASAPSKKELRRRRAGQKVGNIEDDDEEEEDKSQQKDNGLAAVLSAVAKSNALNSSRTMTRAQSEALSSTTMGSSGSTSSLHSPESLIANSEASSDRGLVETSGVDPRGRSASGLGDCESIEERPKASKKTEELADAWSMTDAAEGAESIDGEVADWVNRIHAVDDCFDFSELQGTRSQEPHSLAQVQLRDEVTRCQAPARAMTQSDSNPAGQACARELFPASLQPAPKKAEGAGLAAELRAIFPSASIHIGPPAEGLEVSGTVSSPTPPTACPTPPLATTQTLRHTMHYLSTTSSIISAGVPEVSSVAPPGLPNELYSTAPTVHFSSHVSSISSAGPHSEQNASWQGSTTQGTAHSNCFGTLSQTGPSGLHGGVGSAGVNSTMHQWVGSSSPPDFANGDHGGRSSLHSAGSSMDGAATSKNPPLAAEVLFNLPTSASLGPTPTGALSVAQVEASTKASAWRAQLRRNGVQHLTEVEHALRRRIPPTEQTTSTGMCGSSSAHAAHSCPDGNSQTEGSSWQAEHLSEGVPQNRWMQNPMAGEHPNHEQVPGDMMHQEMMSQRWSMQQQQHADLPFAAPPNLDLMGTCSDAAMEQIGASEVWRDQSLLSAASAPPKLWENQAASLAPQQYAESQAQYQAAYDEMYKSMLVARLEAAVPESYED